MNTLRKQIKAGILAAAIALGVMFGSTQKSEAAYYDVYYTYYSEYINLWNSNHNYCDLYTVYAFLYYWYSAFYGDDAGVYLDPDGNKSDKRINASYYSSFTSHDDYYNLYVYYGDFYYRLCHTVANR